METHPLSEPSSQATPSAAPPAADALTVWEAKERAGLLALETEEWREKRRIAEDPDTTADVLDNLADDIRTLYDADDDTETDSFVLLIESIAAHPNTAPQTLDFLLSLPYAPFNVRGFCRNPVLPFLCLEKPDFWQCLARAGATSTQAILREPALPTPAVVEFSQSATKPMAQAALLHVLLSGEIATQSEGCNALVKTWQDFCWNESRYPLMDAMDFRGQHWYAETVELGLAPAWALGQVGTIPLPPPPTEVFVNYSDLLIKTATKQERMYLAADPLTAQSLLVQLAEETDHADGALIRRMVCLNPNAPPSIAHHARRGFVGTVGDKLIGWSSFNFASPSQCGGDERPAFNQTAFINFIGALNGAYDLPTLREMGEWPEWHSRLNVALVLPVTAQAFKDDRWNRSPLDLLHHLTRDGNRLVRWAAKTRLADPDFTFTWHEGNE